MTKSVVYKDQSIDARVLGAEDLKKAGVEGFKKTTFRNGQPVEVADEVAQALTEHALFSGFSIHDPSEDVQPVEIATTENTTPPAQDSGDGPSKRGRRSSTP